MIVESDGAATIERIVMSLRDGFDKWAWLGGANVDRVEGCDIDLEVSGEFLPPCVLVWCFQYNEKT